MEQADFVDLVERARLTNTQAIYLRLSLGIDDVPMKYSEIGAHFGVSKQAVHALIQKAKARIARCPFIPGAITRARHSQRTHNPGYHTDTIMTIAKAQKIIGGTVAAGERDQDGYVRVACYGPRGEVISETARNIPDALKLLIRTHYDAQRAFVLERDHYRCTNCGGLRNLTCDHKVSRARGERCDHHSNLITLCTWCHDLRHSRKKFHLSTVDSELVQTLDSQGE